MLATGSQSKVAARRASPEMATEDDGGTACKKSACTHHMEYTDHMEE